MANQFKKKEPKTIVGFVVLHVEHFLIIYESHAILLKNDSLGDYIKILLQFSTEGIYGYDGIICNIMDNTFNINEHL